MTDHAALRQQIQENARWVGERINSLCMVEFDRLKAAGHPPFSPFDYAKEPERKLGPWWGRSKYWKAGISQADAHANFCLLYPTMDIAIALGWEERSEAKALALAGRVSGLYGHDVRHATSDIRASGRALAAQAWAPHMRASDPKCFGYVYSARADEHPSIVKVGFSTRVDERLKELARQVCSPVRLITCFPSTQLHEYTIHQCLGRRRIGSEWYPRSIVPDWLLQPSLRAVA